MPVSARNWSAIEWGSVAMVVLVRIGRRATAKLPAPIPPSGSSVEERPGLPPPRPAAVQVELAEPLWVRARLADRVRELAEAVAGPIDRVPPADGEDGHEQGHRGTGGQPGARELPAKPWSPQLFAAKDVVGRRGNRGHGDKEREAKLEAVRLTNIRRLEIGGDPRLREGPGGDRDRGRQRDQQGGDGLDAAAP